MDYTTAGCRPNSHESNLESKLVLASRRLTLAGRAYAYCLEPLPRTSYQDLSSRLKDSHEHMHGVYMISCSVHSTEVRATKPIHASKRPGSATAQCMLERPAKRVTQVSCVFCSCKPPRMGSGSDNAPCY